MRTLALCTLLVGCFAEAEARYPCSAPAAIQEFSADRYGSLSPRDWQATIARIREALETSPDDLFLNRWLIEWQLRPFTGALADEYRKKLDQRPNDLVRQYLYAHALTGKDTPSAIELLKKVIARDPKFPWSYLALTEIYASAAFRDPRQVAQNLSSYAGICPANLDVFAHLNVIQDDRELRHLAAQLRSALEKTKDPKQFRSWSTLWAAEFRLTPPADLETAEKTVAADLKRLEPLVPDTDWSALGMLSEGYRLSGQPDGEKRINDRIAAARPRDESSAAIMAWYKDHPWKSGNERAKALYEISGEWVKKWPESWTAWSQRRTALVELHSRSAADWTEVGNGIARSDYNGDPHFRSSLIAQDWVAAGVKLSLAVIYMKGLLYWCEGPDEPVSDLIRGTIAADLDARRLKDFEYVVLITLARAEWMLKDYAGEHKTLQKLRRWLDTDFRKDYHQTPMIFPDHEGRYLEMMSLLAEAEGRKADALAYEYQLTTNPWYVREYGNRGDRAYRLFKELGGSDDAWALMSKAQPWPAGRPEPPRGASLMPWDNLDRPLPEMHVPDSAGRVWTRADFEGKTTFVFLWATSCGPCWRHLPVMQKLYDAVKDRSDVQAISLSLDENPAVVKRFMKERNYTFPVLVDKAYAERILPEVILGQIWMVDKAGRIRLRRQEWGFSDQLCLDEALDQLNHPPL